MLRTELLFCRPVTPQALEDRMDLEAEAAEELGIGYHSVVLEDVVDGNLERALDGLPKQGRRLLYRGWMLTEEEYAALHEALLERGHSLVVAPDEYAAAHYLPNYQFAPWEWIPFGGGTRRCVGMAFSLYEMRMVLSTLLARTELRRAPGPPIRVVRRGITLSASGGMPVILERREARTRARSVA